MRGLCKCNIQQRATNKMEMRKNLQRGEQTILHESTRRKNMCEIHQQGCERNLHRAMRPAKIGRRATTAPERASPDQRWWVRRCVDDRMGQGLSLSSRSKLSLFAKHGHLHRQSRHRVQYVGSSTSKVVAFYSTQALQLTKLPLLAVQAHFSGQGCRYSPLMRISASRGVAICSSRAHQQTTVSPCT